MGTEREGKVTLMNVLLNTTPLFNDNAIRGVGVYTQFLSQALEKLQTEQDSFITSGDIGIEQLNAIATKRGIDIVHYPFFDLFRHTLPLPIERKMVGKTKQKVVVTIHDVIPLLYPDEYPVGIKGSFHFYLQKLAAQNVDAIITDSETSKLDIIEKLSITPNKVFAIPLAGNPELRKATTSQVINARSKLNLPDHYLLYVGDINYNKNIPVLLSALNEVSENIHLVCVGKNFYQHEIPEWSAIEKQLPSLKDRIHLITSITKDDTQTLCV